MFCIIFVKFSCHFGVILESFWRHFGVILVPLGVTGRPRGPKTPQDASRIDFASILGCLWDPLGHPSGWLFGVSGRPGDPRTEKNDALEGVCSQARFFIGFSLLFWCLGPLKTRILCGRGIQNHIFDRDRKKRSFGAISAWV